MSLTDEQMAVLDGQTTRMTMHMQATGGNTMQRRCDALGLTISTFTPKKKGRYGTPDTTFFLDGDETEYKSLAQVADAIIARRKSEVQHA